jgi:YaiO family outer membrane protein
MPNYQDARILLIDVNKKLNHYAEALINTKIGLTLDPNNKQLQNDLTEITNHLAEKSNPASPNQPPSVPLTPTLIPETLKPSEQTLSVQKESEPKTSFADIKKEYQNNHLNQAIIMARKYLNTYPQDDDVRFILGKSYEKQKNKELAIAEYKIILKHNPNYTDAKTALDHLTRKKVTENITSSSSNKSQFYDFYTLKAMHYYKKGNYYMSAYYAKKALHQNPQNKQAKETLSEIEEISPKYTKGLNELGIISEEDYVSDRQAGWNYTNLFYKRYTPFGSVTGKLNYTYRNGGQALQEALESALVFNKYFYVNIDGGYAANQNLFPNYYVGAEAFAYIPKIFDLSFGDKYSNIINDTGFYTYTGSIAKTFKDYWISFRPYRFVPNAGDKSTLYTATFRRYFANEDGYISLTLGRGQSPDLNDLQTVDFIVINNTIVALNIQIPFLNHRLVFNIGSDYQRQVFPTGSIREITGGIAGIKFRF